MTCEGCLKNPLCPFVAYFVSFVVKHKSLNHKACLSDVRQTGITKVNTKATKEE
jgi:hypothetical protein